MASIDPPGKAKPNPDGAAGRLSEPPTSQALWPTFMRRTIAAESLPRPEKPPARAAGAAS